MKLTRLPIKLTEEQKQKLSDRADALGFSSMSDYARFILFLEPSFIEKIDQIHRKVCGENE